MKKTKLLKHILMTPIVTTPLLAASCNFTSENASVTDQDYMSVFAPIVYSQLNIMITSGKTSFTLNQRQLIATATSAAKTSIAVLQGYNATEFDKIKLSFVINGGILYKVEGSPGSQTYEFIIVPTSYLSSPTSTKVSIQLQLNNKRFSGSLPSIYLNNSQQYSFVNTNPQTVNPRATKASLSGGLGLAETVANGLNDMKVMNTDVPGRDVNNGLKSYNNGSQTTINKALMNFGVGGWDNTNDQAKFFQGFSIFTPSLQFPDELGTLSSSIRSTAASRDYRPPSVTFTNLNTQGNLNNFVGFQKVFVANNANASPLVMALTKSSTLSPSNILGYANFNNKGVVQTTAQYLSASNIMTGTPTNFGYAGGAGAASGRAFIASILLKSGSSDSDLGITFAQNYNGTNLSNFKFKKVAVPGQVSGTPLKILQVSSCYNTNKNGNPGAFVLTNYGLFQVTFNTTTQAIACTAVSPATSGAKILAISSATVTSPTTNAAKNHVAYLETSGSGASKTYSIQYFDNYNFGSGATNTPKALTIANSNIFNTSDFTKAVNLSMDTNGSFTLGTNKGLWFYPAVNNQSTLVYNYLNNFSQDTPSVQTFTAQDPVTSIATGSWSWPLSASDNATGISVAIIRQTTLQSGAIVNCLFVNNILARRGF